MKVLYLTRNPNLASTTRPMEGWFMHLREQGLEPVLVCDRLGELRNWAGEEGIPAYHVPLPFPSKLRPWPFLSSLVRLRKVVRKHEIELIHCNEQDSYPTGQWLARVCGLPVVVSVHFRMERPFCEWAFARRRAPNLVFFVSNGNLNACRPSMEGIVPESRWRVLYNGIDLCHYRQDETEGRRFRQRYGLGSDLLIGTASWLRSRKQLEQLFEAAARLSSPNLRVVLAGNSMPGEESYATQLISLGRQLLGDRLCYVGHLDDLRGLYNALDIYVNTSREEACSISVLEAMSCGCPVIGYPSKSTVDEQILPGGGEIVAQDRVDQLAEALAAWLGDRRRLVAGRTGARQRAEQCFDSRAIALQLWREYQNLLQSKGGDGALSPVNRDHACSLGLK